MFFAAIRKTMYSTKWIKLKRQRYSVLLKCMQGIIHQYVKKLCYIQFVVFIIEHLKY